MGRTVRIDDLANEIMDGLTEYADLATDNLKAAVKKAAVKVESAVKKPVAKVNAAKLEIYIQSPLGGNITPEEIAAKLPKGAESVFVRVDQNKLWWIMGEESGSVDIW